MRIYGLAIDITKDRMYKVAHEKKTNEMARNTILGLQSEGKSKAEIIAFLTKFLGLSPDEITQAF